MSYQALYRAWRPAGFSGVVGQEPITTTLARQVLSGHIAHAYLFSGSRGTGKTSTAKVLARAINCQGPKENGDPCGECEVCRALGSENNMDVIEIDAASNNGVDEIRELRGNIRYPPTIGRYKVYIIDEVHMLSTGAFNALLKTLEEPPSHAVFILATTEPQKLPATILSRCQRYDFKRIPAAAIVGKLQMELSALGREAEPEALMEIARASEGGMRDAESLMDMCLSYGGGLLTAALVRDVLGASDRKSLFEFAGALLESRAADALQSIARQVSEGRDAQVFAREAAQHMRALMLAQLMPEELAELLDLTNEDAGRYIEQARGAAPEKLMRVMELFIGAGSQMRWASQPRAVLELCAVRACRPEREQGLEAMAERIAALEKKLAEGARVAPPAAAPAPLPDDDDAPFDADPAPWREQEPAHEPAKAQPAEPKEQPSSANAAGWDKAVALVRERDKAILGPVSHLRFVEIEGDTVRLAMPKRWNMFIKTLQTEAKQRVLNQCLSEAFGRPLEAAISEEGSAPAVSTAPARKNIEQVYDVFGRENVSIVDEL